MLIKNKTFSVVTLGCRTNICESNDIVNQLKELNAKWINEFASAQICVVNTCCVTNKAEAKSRYFIQKALRSHQCELLIVVGCLLQLHYETLNTSKKLIVLGSKLKQNIKTYISEYIDKPIIAIESFNKNDTFDRLENFQEQSNTRAFVKIQDGCNHMCSYCVIPFVRGRQRSLEHDVVIKQINALVNNDCHEIVLTGVNTADYLDKSGYDLYKLLCDINQLPGNFRVRFSSLEPFKITKKIIDLLTNNQQRWCQHLHICLQSGCNQTLKKMQRHYTINDFSVLCKYIRNRNKLMSITTDCIIGFPTETVGDYEEGFHNIKKINFADIHLFPYSPRPFTKATKFINMVSGTEKQKRFKKMNELKLSMQKCYLRQFINRTVKVLFEKSKNSHTQSGHSEYFFLVHVATCKKMANKMLNVKITKLVGNKLFGEIIKASNNNH